DDRMGGSKALCIKDSGPTSVGVVTINSDQARQFLNRGCLQGSIYSDAAYGSVNYNATLAGMLGNLGGIITGDIYDGVVQPKDLRKVAVSRKPTYVATNDLVELNLELDIGDSLQLTSLSSYLKDELYADSTGPGYGASRTFNAG